MISQPTRDVIAPGPDLDLPTRPAGPTTRAYLVRAELSDDVSDDEVHADLIGDPTHRLLEFGPQIRTTASGRAEVGLTLPGPDVWTSVLTAMAILKQSGYDLYALHVVSQESAQGCR